jgi:hypothetical protein
MELALLAVSLRSLHKAGGVIYKALEEKLCKETGLEIGNEAVLAPRQGIPIGGKEERSYSMTTIAHTRPLIVTIVNPVVGDHAPALSHGTDQQELVASLAIKLHGPVAVLRSVNIVKP